MFDYKIDVLSALKQAGYSTYRLRKEKLLAESTMQDIRNKKIVSWGELDKICALLKCQPGDIIFHVNNLHEK